MVPIIFLSFLFTNMALLADRDTLPFPTLPPFTPNVESEPFSQPPAAPQVQFHEK